MAITHFPLKLVSRRMVAPTVAHLSFLRDDGLPAYKAGAWRIDCRSFRKWATRYTPYKQQPKPHTTTYKEEQLF